MGIKAVLGCLYGDEGKAKIVDALAGEVDVIIRFQGGSNAGHTIQFGKEKNVLHLIPSGIFHQNQICVLASGVVIDLFQLEKEMTALEAKSVVFKGRFYIDERASIVLPIHKTIDQMNEDTTLSTKIGTTLRGIGPCYADSISRIGIKMYDLHNKEILSQKISEIYKKHKMEISDKELIELSDSLHNFSITLKDCIINLPYLLDDWIKKGKEILFEGAQGSLLDVYFGTYPFVTSSHTIAGGISSSVGCSPKKIDKIIGVYKSYFTRVGSGPFPTELTDEIGDKIRKQGNEYGSTTGRPRRCGWFDIVSAKYSAMINGIDMIALTLLDVLSGIEKLKICVGYEYITNDSKLSLKNPSRQMEFPADSSLLGLVKPKYIELCGWNEDLSFCKEWNALPKNAQIYVKTIEELLCVPINIISIGPKREQTIYIK